jgi:hypothetical protein
LRPDTPTRNEKAAMAQDETFQIEGMDCSGRRTKVAAS